MNLKIDIEEKAADKYLIFLYGEIDVYTAPNVKGELLPLTNITKNELVIDLSNVSYMDSTGLGVFIGLFKNARSHEGELKFIGLSDRLKRLFKITGLADIMNIDSSGIEGGIK